MDDPIQILVRRKAIYLQYLISRGFSRSDAEDLFQEAAERFLRIQSSQAIENPQGYFSRMLANATRDLWRRRRRLVVVFDSDLVGRYFLRRLTGPDHRWPTGHRIMRRKLPAFLIRTGDLFASNGIVRRVHIPLVIAQFPQSPRDLVACRQDNFRRPHRGGAFHD